MRSTSQYIIFTVAVTGALFGLLFIQSADLIGGDRGAGGSRAADRRPSSATRPAAPAPPGRVESPGVTFSSSPSPAARVEEDAVARLGEENRRLKTANAVLEQRLTAVLNWILTNFRGKFPLPEKLVSRVNLQPVTEEYVLSPEVAELFRITPDEEAQINDAFAYAWNYMAQVEAALITSSAPRQDKVILHIPAYQDDGQVLREDLYAALEATLGQNRFDRFLQVSEGGLQNSFAQFGEAARTMVFELVYDDEHPYPQLKVKDGYVIEISPNERTVTATESVVTNLPAKYSAYLAWLPDYVQSYSTQ